MKSSLPASLACFALATAASLLEPAPAQACGGCFVPPQVNDITVVTDHRMALSVSPTQTVLWDQIRYSGDPAEFAWVLPVRGGATIQLSNDEFFSALDASSQPVIRSPAVYGGAYGCALTGCGSQSNSAFDSSGAPGAGQVQIVSQSVVGPYETVTLRATDPSALRNWLKSHAYDIPSAIDPTIDAYVREEFDFIALRMRPDCGERSMQPVRIVTPGADPTLPLRMVAAGIGAKVGLTLYVISEGRWQPQNFPFEVVDHDAVLWDRTQQKSNYEPLTEQLMAKHDGRNWVVEYADQPQLFSPSDPRYPAGQAPGATTTGVSNGITPGLADTYYGLCPARPVRAVPPGSGAAVVVPVPSATPFTPCRDGSDAGVGAQDAGVANQDDGGATDAGSSDAASGDSGLDPDAAIDGGAADPDAGTDDGGADPDDGGSVADDAAVPDGGLQPPYDAGSSDPYFTGECLGFDDIDVALKGLHPRDVWVTRLRASLPSNAVAADDLRLEAATEQVPVSSVYNTTNYTDDESAGAGQQNACLSAPKRHTAFGTWAFAAVAALAGVAFLRRRTRRGRP